ncbi:CHASE2 domain-containing protein [Acidovorax sp. MR-S7]|uniref:CHASE2 domain-containing protein n=1 Tax=Acidovorax sp. MR-S7 TaxID=1268622 RepID=UPI00035FB749|nr:CHASE2 domain-containing protein [Acidovorax sp. MR-S7]
MSPAIVQARSRAGLRREWLVLSALLLGLVAWLCASDGLRRLDHLVQDAGMRLHALPAHPDIAIVAIDDRSIEAIGRWPWRRALHAQLVRQISEQSPRALGLDILFGEEDPDYPGDDLLLARALESNGHAVLPVARRGQGGTADLPLPALHQAASALGHVQVQVDSDGVARGLFRLEGPTSAPWPHFSTAMLCAADSTRPQCAASTDAGTGPWVRQDPQILAFARGQPAFATYSYIDVLTGQAPANALRDKYVLVGATATGLGDMFAAPVASRSERIAGVELIAHALNAELAQSRIQPAPLAWNLAFNLAPVALALLGILLLGPLAGLMSCAAWFAGTLAAAMLAPGLAGWQLAAAPALAGVALVYPLWSWRRLSAAAHFLQLEMQELQRVGLSPLPEQPERPLLRGDVLERRIQAVEDATRRLRKLHHFVSNSLQHLPSPTFVCDAGGRVTLANEAALRYCPQPPLGLPITRVLSDLVQSETGALLLPRDARQLASMPPQQEARDAQGRHLLMLCKPFADDDSTLWLTTLVDLTDMRRAQAQRDQALHFISHDIRAPIASILTLLEMQRAFPGRMAQPDLLARIDRYAQSSLTMAQSFVRLASAQADTYHHAPFDLAAALEEAVDDAWASAHKRGVRVQLAPGPAHAACLGDRNLVCRAIGNVLGNAIKFSPAGGTVHCALQAQAPCWVVSVRDEGPGIAQELQADLFQPFKRLHGESHPDIGGVGLGLALVHTVVQRHGGRVEVRSEGGKGAEFRLVLPQADAPEAERDA